MVFPGEGFDAADTLKAVAKHRCTALHGVPTMSPVGYIACVTCHQPDRAFTDTKARAHGLADLPRNTPALANLSLQRWYGWGGASDSLWMASIKPILDAREFNGNAALVTRLFAREPELAACYRRVFGVSPLHHPERTVVNVGKALAAYVETLVTARTPFDEFRDALARGDSARAAAYPVAAQRGLKLFVGRAGCVACHSGPNFSDGRFHAGVAPADDMMGRMLVAIISGQMLGSAAAGLVSAAFGWRGALTLAAAVAVIAALWAWTALPRVRRPAALPTPQSFGTLYAHVFDNRKAVWLYAAVVAEGTLVFAPFPYMRKWVVDAGWITSERQSPTLARCENSCSASMKATPCAREPRRSKLNTEPQPRGSSVRASAWSGWDSSSG